MQSLPCRSITPACTSAFRVLVFFALAPAACSSPGSRGGGPSINSVAPAADRIVCSEYYQPCPSSVLQGGTALEELANTQSMAEASAAGAEWSGYFEGRDIDRSGRPTTNAKSGWNFEFCAPASGNIVDFSIGKGGCSAANLCDKHYTCGAPTAVPALDADDAIAAAFPGDPATAVYEVIFVTKGGRAWAVAHKETPDRFVGVDSETGALLP